MEREPCDVKQMLQNKEIQNICAPMVRYSKLEFRNLVRKYGCDLCFSPMIVADSFVQSIKARHNEFTTNLNDSPLVVQFASNNVSDLVEASKLVSPYCDGVDINCGCPQSWAISKGFGCHLLSKPELVKDMVLQLRNCVDRPFSVSIKIRIQPDIRKTVDLCRSAESAGVSFVTVHGRTQKQRKEPVDTDAVKLICQSLAVPVIANGDVRNLQQLYEMQEKTLCHGIMAGRGLLTNPAMFAGYDRTPLSCIQDWLDISANSTNIHFMTFHHHLVFMMEKIINRKQKALFNNLKRMEDVIEFLDESLDIQMGTDGCSDKSLNLFKINYPDSDICGSYFKSFTSPGGEEKRHFEDYLEGSCLPYCSLGQSD